MATALAMTVLGQDSIWLRNQGSIESRRMQELDCVGPGVSCRVDTSSGVPVGRLFVDAGNAAMRATAPLYVDGGYVACAPASGSSGGCVTTGAQTYAGDKVHSGLVQFTEDFPRNLGPESVNVSAINYHGEQIGGPLLPTLDNNSIVLQSRRANNDVAPGVIVQETFFRDAGGPFAVLQGLPCRTPLISVPPSGGLVHNAAPMPNCVDAPDILERGAITSGQSASGSVNAQSYDGLYYHTRGRLSHADRAVQLDGGRPPYDGGLEVILWPDGGTNYAYAGAHGNDVKSVPSPGLTGAWLEEYRNPNGRGGDTKLVVDPEGGLNNCHGLTVETLPPCPGWSRDVLYDGTLYHYAYGAGVGTLQCAEDTEHVEQYYLCRSTGWKQLEVAQ